MQELHICILGLGYVGLPLAVAFSKEKTVIGFDVDVKRIQNLEQNIDFTGEVTGSELENANISFTSDPSCLFQANVFIITVPTPINSTNEPDLEALKAATNIVAKNLKFGDLVIYESTVYPGTTVNICTPILEEISKLKANVDFDVGYSPERINPGDRARRLESITKVVSGGTPAALKRVSNLYNNIIDAGVYEAENIETAEAAKILENTQRDINIALMNECSQLFSKLDISMKNVLNAAKTKWNFLNFHPGLVGGHCIGVDPYYLAYVAKLNKFDPKMILSGRSTNDSMVSQIFQTFLSLFTKNLKANSSKKVLFLGLTFKPNCPDTRNSKALEFAKLLLDHDFKVDFVEPYNSSIDTGLECDLYNLEQIFESDERRYNIIFYAVDHKTFNDVSLTDLNGLLTAGGLFFDFTHRFDANEVDWQI